MAKYVVTSQKVTVNGTDVSDACARAELVLNAAEVETTDFGSVQEKLSASASVRNVSSVHSYRLACNYILCQFISPYT